jgi:hypothetical protein
MSHQAHLVWPTEAHLKSPLGFDSTHLGGLQLLVLPLSVTLLFFFFSFVFSRELLIPSSYSATAAAAAA